jgi:ribA/ribD-fused uncharacterized protein
MFCKALYFSDAENYKKTLTTPDPKTHKIVGQQVKNFKFYHRGLVKSRAVRVGSWYKYTAPGNRHMREILLRTRERELTEAARRDRIWGLGMRLMRRRRIAGLGGESVGEGFDEC